VVRHERNRGFTGAMSTCFRHARGDWIFLAPADGQISMSEVKRFLTEIPRADIVVGVREQRLEGAGRKTLSRAFHLIARLLFGPTGLGSLRATTVFAAILAAIVGVFAATLPANDPDLFWHLASGAWMIDHRQLLDRDVFSFTMAGTGYSTGQWLGEVVYAALY